MLLVNGSRTEYSCFWTKVNRQYDTKIYDTVIEREEAQVKLTVQEAFGCGPALAERFRIPLPKLHLDLSMKIMQKAFWEKAEKP